MFMLFNKGTSVVKSDSRMHEKTTALINTEYIVYYSIFSLFVDIFSFFWLMQFYPGLIVSEFDN